jgi:hypothetical protein
MNEWMNDAEDQVRARTVNPKLTRPPIGVKIGALRRRFKPRKGPHYAARQGGLSSLPDNYFNAYGRAGGGSTADQPDLSGSLLLAVAPIGGRTIALLPPTARRTVVPTSGRSS